MIDFRIDARTRERLADAREWGRSAMRPAGLEADRLSAPLPIDQLSVVPVTPAPPVEPTPPEPPPFPELPLPPSLPPRRQFSISCV